MELIFCSNYFIQSSKYYFKIEEIHHYKEKEQPVGRKSKRKFDQAFFPKERLITYKGYRPNTVNNSWILVKETTVPY